MKRRAFIKGGAALTIGIFLGPGCLGPRAKLEKLGGGGLVLKPNAYVRLFADGRIVLVLAPTEMGVHRGRH